MRHLIIGAGAAGVAAAKVIRRFNDDAEIVLVGDERCFPYQRFRLVDHLCGIVRDADLLQCEEGELGELGIALRRGQRVTGVDPNAKTVRLEHGEIVPYDRLLIATGRCPCLGASLRPFRRHIQTFYTLDDARLLRQRLGTVEHVIVSGCGMSTLDLIRGLLLLEKKVTYVFPGAKVELPLLDAGVAATVNAALAKKGVQVVPNDRIVFIDASGQGYRVTTVRGRTIDADLVCAVATHEPNLTCIGEAGIVTRSGILVDGYMRTTAEDVYAAGDCVEVYHPALRNYWINFGWPNAVQQGVIAGTNMAGHIEEYRINETLVFNLLGQPFAARWWN